jgi:hypothetical protein
MTPPGTISREKSTLPGAEYVLLRTEAIHRVQTMSGDIWTDYNFSDPGVTIIEQLCYALTELPYRASFDVADLLCAPGKTQPQLRRQGLFPATSILPCNPVTANDFRRVILDRVADVANVWFIPAEDRAEQPIAGLYHVAILAGPPKADADRPGARLIERVRHCYTAHRTLCEDIGELTILHPVETIVHARIEIGNRADPSDTLADALFALGLTLAPEPRRMSLAEKRAIDPDSVDIFSGPLMLRGFIADDQLQPFPTTFTANQLVEVLAEVDGVLTVDHLSVELSGERHRFTGATEFTVPENGILRLRTTPEGGAFTISMFRNGARCEPDAGRVRRRLTECWKQQRKTYPLRSEYAVAYPVPTACYRDLASYSSVQDQFPIVYGIGPGGLPLAATANRRAQAKQLKGYLMPFDQMLADAFSQIAFIRDLFSLEAGGDTTYAWQSLRDIVPDVNRMQLLHPDYEAQLADLVAETDPVAARRNGILDLLLSFYALQLTAPDGTSADVQENAARAESLISAKRMLLRRAATATRDRGRGVDYLRPASSRRMSGAELLSSIELGLLDSETGEPRAVAPIGVEDPEQASFGQMLPSELWPSVERVFRTLDDDNDDDQDADGVSLIAGERVDVGLLAGLKEPDGYRIGGASDADGLVLVCRDADGRWWLIAEFDDEWEARRAVRALRRAARHLDHRHLYLVDWILLRHAMIGHESDAHRYNFRVSAVLAAPADDSTAAGWMAQATTILRGNTPAHVALDCLFLDAGEMARFNRLYRIWTRALRHGPRSALAEASRRLEYFLTRHTPGPLSQEEPQDRPGISKDDQEPADEPSKTTPSDQPPPPAEPADEPEAPVPVEDTGSELSESVPASSRPVAEEEDDDPSVWSRLLDWLRRLLPRSRHRLLVPPSSPSQDDAQQAPESAGGGA